MKHNNFFRIAVVAISAVIVVALVGDVYAGNFKRMVGVMADGGGVNCAYVTPKNTGTAMEMDVYEFQTYVADSYRCCISGNTTGQDLYVRLIGLIGNPLASFVTPVNGTGCTGYIGLGASYLFQCTVASGAGSPVNGSWYRLCVQRQ